MKMENSKDKLDQIFEYQRDLQTRLGTWDKIKTESDKQAFINQMILAIHEEAVELMQSTPYKNPDVVKFGWKKTQAWDIENYKLELIDLVHFIINLALVVDMTPAELFSRYINKNVENYARQDRGY